MCNFPTSLSHSWIKSPTTIGSLATMYLNTFLVPKYDKNGLLFKHQDKVLEYLYIMRISNAFMILKNNLLHEVEF